MNTISAALTEARALTTTELARQGVARHRLRRLVSAGVLIRLRNGRFVPAGTDPRLIDAGRLGGRLDCVSLLAALGVFVREQTGTHLQFDPATARLPARPRDVRAHWRAVRVARESLVCDLVSALAQACRCQAPRDAIATLDSAWHAGLVDAEAIGEVFALLPARLQPLRPLLDCRSESGTESLMRLILRTLGASIEIQVRIDGVGRVDFVVDGWLIVECDSQAHHGGWEAQRRDRRRDLAAAAVGYTTVRPLAEDILYRRDAVTAALAATLAHGPRQCGR